MFTEQAQWQAEHSHEVDSAMPPHSLFERLGQRPGRIVTACSVVGEQPAAIDRGSQLGHGERRSVPTKRSGRPPEKSASFVVVQHCWTIVKTEACCPGVDDAPTQRVECVDRDVAGGWAELLADLRAQRARG